MKLRADLHIHTYYSYDSSLPPDELVKKARELRLDVLGIADHGTCKGALDAREIAKGNPIILVGQEIKTDSGEILVFGIEEDLEQLRPLKETCSEAKNLGGIIIVPHPFDKFRWGIGDQMKDILNLIDAIEGFNSMCTLDMFNKKAQDFATRNNKPVVAGSDTHFKNEIGRAITMIESKRDEKSIFEAIRKGRTETLGKKTGISKRIGSRIKQKLKNNKKTLPEL